MNTQNFTYRQPAEVILSLFFNKLNWSGSNILPKHTHYSQARNLYLQVSVPIHAEDWDAASLIPIVAFVPLEYEDDVRQSVAGYKSDGSRIAVDAINPPDKVVIVVGQNERMARIRQDDVITPFDDFTYPPSAPTNLKATTTAETVQLSWTKPSSLNGTIGYYVYRKSSSNATFKMYSTLNGVDNVVYYDQTAEAGKTYFYYVVAYSDYFLNSAPSSIVSAVGARPAVLSSFEVNALTNTQVELRWVTESADYQKVQLYRQVVGNNSDYQLHQEFGSNVYDYFDNNMHLLAGKKIQYRIQTVTSAGSISIPKYDFLYMPYRNPSYNSPIRIKRIQCSDNVEGWLMGTPEILIKVYGVDSERKTTEVASIWFDMNSYNQSFNQFVLNWKPDNWYQRYTFHAIEEDPGKDIKISIAANIGVKKTEGVMTAGFEAGISKEFNFSQPEDIGTADLSFYDPINATLFFQKGKYGCYVTLGE